MGEKWANVQTTNVDAFISNVFEVFGPVITLVLLLIALPIWIWWKVRGEHQFKSAAEAAGRLAAEKQLADHKARLEIDAEVVRAEFQRKLSSFAVFAENRHQAVADFVRTLALIERSVEMYIRPSSSVNHNSHARSNIYQEVVAARTSLAKNDLYLSPVLRTAAESVARSLDALADAYDVPDAEPSPIVDLGRLRQGIARLIELAQAELRDDPTLKRSGDSQVS